MLSRLVLSVLLLLPLQLTPQIRWSSEVKESPEGNQLVLTGELDPGIDHVTGTVTYMPCAGEACYMPVDWDFEEFFKAGSVSSVKAADTPRKERNDAGNLWALILEAILWGFAMLLTPCVFPMVPMTVSFFMKGSENPRQGRLKAFLYGLFIVLLYTVPICLIIGITWLVGGSGVTADIFNWLSTHWLPNIIFFLVFMVFAASFLILPKFI